MLQLNSWSVDNPEQLDLVPVIQKVIKNLIAFPSTGVYQEATPNANGFSDIVTVRGK